MSWLDRTIKVSGYATTQKEWDHIFRKKKPVRQKAWLRPIPDGKIPCYLCGKYVPEGTFHCGFKTILAGTYSAGSALAIDKYEKKQHKKRSDRVEGQTKLLDAPGGKDQTCNGKGRRACRKGRSG
jgi:hypothetical protein